MATSELGSTSFMVIFGDGGSFCRLLECVSLIASLRRSSKP